MSPFLLSGHNIDPEITPIYAVRGGAHPFAFKVANTFRQDPGTAAVLLPPPPGIVAGDLLEITHTATGPVVAGWTRWNTSGMVSHERIATGTAADDFLLRVEPGNGTLAVYAVFSTPAGAAVNLQTPALAQRFGLTNFVQPAFLLDGGFSDTLIVHTGMRSGNAPTLTPIFANAGGGGYQIAGEIYQDWNTRPGGSNTFDYTAISFNEETDAIARAEQDLVYSPFEGAAAIVNNGRSRRYRA